jgi:ankyrin repeat protein
MYDYTTPLQFAVREGHLDLVRYFVEHRALDPTFRNHPFLEPLDTLAADRGFGEMAAFLRRSLDDPALTREWGDTGEIDRGLDDARRRFQGLVDRGRHAEVEEMLTERPELARDPDAFWGEGILAMPAKGGDRPMLELLMRHGARVPDVSKWGARYYFKHYDTAAFLLGTGMNPDHSNWRQFTLLHDMAFEGDARKARLLLDHGADVDAIDDEYRSTPLGYAAHFGKPEVVALLLERGADPNAAGAAWSSPLAWARRKGHVDIEAALVRAGAVAEPGAI